MYSGRGIKRDREASKPIRKGEESIMRETEASGRGGEGRLRGTMMARATGWAGVARA
jgi:hypothetical protein